MVFAATLAKILPPGLDQVLPLSTGGESNDSALRIAKTYTGSFETVVFDRSWHGVTGGAEATILFRPPPWPWYDPAGALTLPTPHAYRWPFNRDGVYDWRAEFEFG